MKLLSGLTVLLGAWLVISPFAFEATDMAMWNNLIVGLAIIVLAGFNFYRLNESRLANTGVASLVALLGLWALVIPFVIDMGAQALLWGTAIAGLIVAIVAAFNAYTNRQAAAGRRAARA